MSIKKAKIIVTFKHRYENGLATRLQKASETVAQTEIKKLEVIFGAI